MPLVWDKTDFLGYLQVEPEVGEYEVEYRYKVSQLPLRLLLSVFHYAGDVCITVFCDPIEWAVVDAGNPRSSWSPSGESNVETTSSLWPPSFWGGGTMGIGYPYGVRLFVRPDIRVELSGRSGERGARAVRLAGGGRLMRAGVVAEPGGKKMKAVSYGQETESHLETTNHTRALLRAAL